jgi:hypothetical protein
MKRVCRGGAQGTEAVMEDPRHAERSPAEDYPGPDGETDEPDVAGAQTDGLREGANQPYGNDRATAVGDAVAAFGPPLEHENDPDTVMDTHEKRLRVESRERIDSPPAVDPMRAGSHPPEPRFAIADHEAQTDPPPDPPGMPRPLSHDADEPESRRRDGGDEVA